MSSLVRRIEALIDLLGTATLYLTLVMISLVAVNVLLRYAFSFGSVWAQELEWHLLATVILLGMSHALQRGDNVRVDVFYAGFSPRMKYLVDLASGVLLLSIALLFVKLSWAYVLQSWSIGERSPDPGGIPMRWAIKGLMPVGFLLVALHSAAALVLRVRTEAERQAADHV